MALAPWMSDGEQVDVEAAMNHALKKAAFFRQALDAYEEARFLRSVDALSGCVSVEKAWPALSRVDDGALPGMAAVVERETLRAVAQEASQGSRATAKSKKNRL